MNPKNNLFLNAKFIETYTTSSYIKYPNYLYYWYHIFIYQIIFNQKSRYVSTSFLSIIPHLQDPFSSKTFVNIPNLSQTLNVLYPTVILLLIYVIYS